jgi:hypothetical protein
MTDEKKKTIVIGAGSMRSSLSKSLMLQMAALAIAGQNVERVEVKPKPKTEPLGPADFMSRDERRAAKAKKRKHVGRSIK